MNKGVKIALNIIIWSALTVYTVFAVRYCSQRKEEITCTGLSVVVKDSANLRFITPSIVRNILINGNIKLTGEKMSDINTIEINKLLSTKGFIKSSKVYTSLDSKLHVEIEQRTPIMRLQTNNGYGIYISEDNYVLPIQRYFSVDVPIVTGVIDFPFSNDYVGELISIEKIENGNQKKYAKNYIFLYKLIKFVKFLEKDSFWGNQVVQINVLENQDLELVPRIGNSIILLGDLDNFNEKLEKLMTFYKKGAPIEGWNKYNYLNIKYANQVICR